ncbi:hypothetical protein ACFY04_39760 [Streptomyces sp. NPDC001549]|uniref:hypothetical protein n=1 Tax=Streptomyces sp. NPDC001549 TaxID=3364586 RepID=UPI00369ADE10
MTSTTPTEPTTSPATGRDDHWVRKLARLRARQLPEQVLQLCDDMSAKQRLDRAKLNVARLRLADAETGGEQKELEAAEAELVAAQEAFDDVSVTLAFRALPRPTLDGLIREHPQTEDNSKTMIKAWLLRDHWRVNSSRSGWVWAGPGARWSLRAGGCPGLPVRLGSPGVEGDGVAERPAGRTPGAATSHRGGDTWDRRGQAVLLPRGFASDLDVHERREVAAGGHGRRAPSRT